MLSAEPDGDRERSGRTPGAGSWLVVVAGLTLVGVVVAGVMITGSDGGGELAPLDDPARWTTYEPSPFAEDELGDFGDLWDPDTARAVAPAPDGSVWVGTAVAGLVRWDADGNDYRRYTPPALAGQAIDHVAVAADGTVWAASQDLFASVDGDGGVVRYDGERWTTYTDDGGLPATRATALVTAGDGTVWAATYEGLARLDGDEWVAQTGEGVPELIWQLAVDGQGALWAATDHFGDGSEAEGVVRFDGHEWRRWTVGEDVPGQEMAALTTGPDGSVWIATRDTPHGGPQDGGRRLLRFDDGDWTVELRDQALPNGRFDLRSPTGSPWVVAADGAMWASLSAGVWHFDDGEWTPEPGLPDAHVTSLATDDAGGLWAATLDGVARWVDGEWTSYATGQGPVVDVTALTLADSGSLWVATTLGVVRYDGTQWNSWAKDQVLASVTSVATGPDGAVWAARRPGVSRFDGQRWTSWTADDGLASGEVWSVAVGDDGSVWAGTRKGVSRFDGQQWTSWTAEDGLAADGVRAVAVGDDGTVWAGTDQGVARFAGQQWTTVPAEEGRAPLDVTALAVGDDAVWAGTSQGLASFDGHRWVHATGDARALDAAAGLAHKTVSAVTVHDGLVWAATSDRLWRFDGHQWTATTDAVPADGIAAIAAADDDAVWTTTHTGLARFDRSDPP